MLSNIFEFLSETNTSFSIGFSAGYVVFLLIMLVVIKSDVLRIAALCWGTIGGLGSFFLTFLSYPSSYIVSYCGIVSLLIIINYAVFYGIDKRDMTNRREIN